MGLIKPHLSCGRAGVELSEENLQFCEPIRTKDPKKTLLPIHRNVRHSGKLPCLGIAKSDILSWERTRTKTEMPEGQESL